MKFRIKDLKNYLGNINGKKIADELTLKSFETSYDNGVLDCDILPNRYADCASLIGISKEILRIENKLEEKKIKKFNEIFQTPSKKKRIIKIINQTKENVPYYFGKVILNVKNEKSPAWLKEFVEFYGFNSINYLVDLANFVMIEYGAPLHIFDLDKVKGNIIIRLAKKGETFLSLDEKEYILEGEEILITDEEKILALGGIKGGEKAGVDLKTKNIFIEAAVFNPEKIYQTSRNLKIKTDASFRFERKVAPIRAYQAIQRLSYLINKNLGGEIYDIQKQPFFRERKIKFDFNKIEKISGLKISEDKVLKILKNLEIKIKNNYLILPLDRLDLNTEEDIVEEIIRIYGWNKIVPIEEKIEKIPFIDENIKFNNYLKDILVKLGYFEGFNYNFFGEKEKEIFKEILEGKEIEIINPLSENYKYFQFSLIPGILKAIHQNQFNFKEIRLFICEKTATTTYADERGLTTQINADKYPRESVDDVKEEYSLSIAYALADRKIRVNPRESASNKKEEILKELLGVLRKIFGELKINYELKETNFSFFEIGGEIFIKKEKVGILGLMKKKILDDFDIDLNVGIIEIFPERLKKFALFEKKFEYWGDFPQIERDLSFIIDEKIKFNEIKKSIESLKIKNLKKIEIIDIYFENIEKGKKSMTIRFVFQNPTTSLKEEEINQEIEKIKNILKEKFKIQFR